jgi:hypothetical protein
LYSKIWVILFVKDSGREAVDFVVFIATLFGPEEVEESIGD